MQKSKYAEILHDNGFSCSQAVLAAFAKHFDLPYETAMKLGTAFGGGMAGTESTCGAVTGALMVIGLKYGKVLPDDNEAKEKTYEITKEFFQSFSCKYKSLLCSDLKMKDRSTPEKVRLSHETCNNYIRDAVIILEELLRNYP